MYGASMLCVSTSRMATASVAMASSRFLSNVEKLSSLFKPIHFLHCFVEDFCNPQGQGKRRSVSAAFHGDDGLASDANLVGERLLGQAAAIKTEFPHAISHGGFKITRHEVAFGMPEC